MAESNYKNLKIYILKGHLNTSNFSILAYNKNEITEKIFNLIMCLFIQFLRFLFCKI